MADEKPLPCPFCGETPEYQMTPGVFGGYQSYSWVCKCGVEKSTIEEWNQRTRIEKIVAIRGGCDWVDASCTHLVVEKSLDLQKVKKEWFKWYVDVYAKQNLSGDKYISFIGLLKTKYNARDANEFDIEEFDD